MPTYYLQQTRMRAPTPPALSGPLVTSVSNPHWLQDATGKAVLLAGSHTWNTVQDIGTGATPEVFNFPAYVTFLTAHKHNCTILWRKDLPTYYNWGAGGTWNMAPWPWLRTGPGNATDGKLKFDLTQLDQTFFDRVRARAILLNTANIYAIVEMFDGLGVSDNRGVADGYPFTGANNINSIDDGGGTASYTMGAPNAITVVQDAFVRKMIDTLNDLPNVIWEHSEEAPDASTWWQGHMIDLIHTYEAGLRYQHPVLFATLNVSGAVDTTLYNSNAEVVAPLARVTPVNTSGSGTPTVKTAINDSDHSYFGMWNDSKQTNRNYIWENVMNGCSVVFMDPYVVNWTTGGRNLCVSPVNGVCSGVDTQWDNLRDNLGAAAQYGARMNLNQITPQSALASTTFCLANAVSSGAEYLVYAASGTPATFTVNLSATAASLKVEWYNCGANAYISAANQVGGSAAQSFTAPFNNDAILYLSGR